MAYKQTLESIGALLEELLEQRGYEAKIIHAVIKTVHTNDDGSETVKLIFMGPPHRKDQEGLVYMNNNGQRKFWEQRIGCSLDELKTSNVAAVRRKPTGEPYKFKPHPDEHTLSPQNRMRIIFKPQTGEGKRRKILRIFANDGRNYWEPPDWETSTNPETPKQPIQKPSVDFKKILAHTGLEKKGYDDEQIMWILSNLTLSEPTITKINRAIDAFHTNFMPLNDEDKTAATHRALSNAQNAYDYEPK